MTTKGRQAALLQGTGKPVHSKEKLQFMAETAMSPRTCQAGAWRTQSEDKSNSGNFLIL
jgi:hypothetical protein